MDKSLTCYITQCVVGFNKKYGTGPKCSEQIKIHSINILDDFFSLSPNPIGLIPGNIQSHLKKVMDAKKSSTLHLWTLNLASMIGYEFLNAEGQLSNDFITLIGKKSIYDKLVATVKATPQSTTIRIRFIHEYLRKIFEAITKLFPKNAQYYNPEIEAYLDQIKDWRPSTLHKLRIQHLSAQLNLQPENIRHCRFWHDQVYDSSASKGGEKYNIGEYTYRLPARIHGIFTAQLSDHDYPTYLAQIDQLRKKHTPLLEHFRKDFRAETTNTFYEAPDVQYVNLGAR